MADCFHHTGRPAVIRCKQCGRGLCGECKVVTDNGVFCSDKCAQAGAVFVERAARLDEQRSRNPHAGMVRLIIAVVVIAVLMLIINRGCL